MLGGPRCWDLDVGWVNGRRLVAMQRRIIINNLFLMPPSLCQILRFLEMIDHLPLAEGVCAYINSTMKKAGRIFETPDIERVWISIRPKWLPRSILVILLAVIYHSTACNAAQNLDLYQYIQQNVDSFLCNHFDALVMITGDFNPVITGFNANRVRQMIGLTQIINVATRENNILDWCLTNKKDMVFEKIQLPPLGSSDHNSVLIKSCTDRACRPSNDRAYKRDLRDSNVRPFDQWITSFDCSVVFETSDCNLKYAEFNDIMIKKIDYYFSLKQTKVRKSEIIPTVVVSSAAF